jgi:hypothetical protein
MDVAKKQNQRSIPVQRYKRRKRCSGGLPECKKYIGDYKDVEGVGCCEECDKYIDENPYDPYWEHMEQDFGESKEYEELKQKGLIEDYDAYQKVFEKFQETYEPWPVMRRRMENERNERKERKERNERK